MTVDWPLTEQDIADTKADLTTAERTLEQIDDTEPFPYMAAERKKYRDRCVAEIERLRGLLEHGVRA